MISSSGIKCWLNISSFQQLYTTLQQMKIQCGWLKIHILCINGRNLQATQRRINLVSIDCYKLLPLRIRSGMKAIYPPSRWWNKGLGSKFQECQRVQQLTPEEVWSVLWSKRCEHNNQNEYADLNYKTCEEISPNQQRTTMKHFI